VEAAGVATASAEAESTEEASPADEPAMAAA
jgi:hypothetical protein